MSYSLNWNLDSIFSGGSHSDALNQRMKQLEDQMNEYYHRVTKWSPSSDNAQQLNDYEWFYPMQQLYYCIAFCQCQ